MGMEARGTVLRSPKGADCQRHDRGEAAAARPARARACGRAGAAHQQRAERVQRQARRAGRLHLRQPRRVLQAPGRARQPAEARAPRRASASARFGGRSRADDPHGDTRQHVTRARIMARALRGSVTVLRPVPLSAGTSPVAALASLPAASYQQSFARPTRRQSGLTCCVAGARAAGRLRCQPWRPPGARTARLVWRRPARAGGRPCGWGRAALRRRRCPRPAAQAAPV